MIPTLLEGKKNNKKLWATTEWVLSSTSSWCHCRGVGEGGARTGSPRGPSRVRSIALCFLLSSLKTGLQGTSVQLGPFISLLFYMSLSMPAFTMPVHTVSSPHRLKPTPSQVHILSQKALWQLLTGYLRAELLFKISLVIKWMTPVTLECHAGLWLQCFSNEQVWSFMLFRVQPEPKSTTPPIQGQICSSCKQKHAKNKQALGFTRSLLKQEHNILKAKDGCCKPRNQTRVLGYH